MCILLHNNRVGISGIIIHFYMFCPNTSMKFREPYHSNHVIPRFWFYVLFCRRHYKIKFDIDPGYSF